MKLTDRVKSWFGGTQDENNSLFGQTQLGNDVLRIGSAKQTGGFASAQTLYVTTSGQSQSGITINTQFLSQNSTVLSCMMKKAQAIAQLPVNVMYQLPDGRKVNALTHKEVPNADRKRAQQVMGLLNNPNPFQTRYDLISQLSQWLDLTGEGFWVWIRKTPDSTTEFPKEVYLLDSTLIAASINGQGYPLYRLSSPAYYWDKGQEFTAAQIAHFIETDWHGHSGLSKGTMAVELVALDQYIDILANYVMLNSTKVTGVLTTEQVIPDQKFKEIAERLKLFMANMGQSRSTDPSKPGQAMLLDSGMKYENMPLPDLQNSSISTLKNQTISRLCALFGVPAAMLGLADAKFNNMQQMRAEWYATTLYPLTVNISQVLGKHLLKGFPSLCIDFDFRDFLKGDNETQIAYAVAAVSNGIMTQNEAREYLGMETKDDDEANKLKQASSPEPMKQSGQSTGGDGGPKVGNTNMP